MIGIVSETSAVGWELALGPYLNLQLGESRTQGPREGAIKPFAGPL